MFYHPGIPGIILLLETSYDSLPSCNLRHPLRNRSNFPLLFIFIPKKQQVGTDAGGKKLEGEGE